MGGKSHIRKAIERRRQLQQLLRRVDLSDQDRTTARQLLTKSVGFRVWERYFDYVSGRRYGGRS